MEDNKYYQLVADLKSGELGLSIVFRAVRTYFEDNENIPEGVRNLLSSPEGQGYISRQFKIITEVVGMAELAYRRGIQEGQNK
ncbi:MAG: hypothetical protein GY941_15200 [Planctomycetes bacterium]|nr:hypothetical protein [Planctomycetota bacterium]